MVRPRQVSDEQIRDAAREVFLEHGPTASLELVAERLGVSAAALFKRSGSKHQLLLRALSPPEKPAWLERAASGPDDSDARAQLSALALDILSYFEDMVPCMAMLAASGISPMQVVARQSPVPTPIRAQRAVVAWMQRAQDRGLLRVQDPHALTFALLGALHMRAFTLHVARAHADLGTREAYVADLIDSLWQGMAPASSSQTRMTSSS